MKLRHTTMALCGHNPVRITLCRLTQFRRAVSYFCVILLWGFVSSSYGSGNGYPLQFVDQHGTPLADVVVEVTVPVHVQPTSGIAIMDQVNKQFQPRLLAITQGQAVSFPNSDDIRHHVYSFSDTKRFELKLYAGTPIQPIRFEQPGVVVLGCNIHDSMVGYIYVSQSKDVLISNQQGIVEIPAYAKQVAIWHALQSQEIDTRRIVTVTQLQQSGSATIEIQAPAPRNTFSEMFKEHHGH
ncbi:methylamine utilization protein [Pseudoalteromonas sp. OOF1S-7]|uniref:methylamine utilization protein n=1 Tax=Pseudoalteromonas sp. OOF1S-7 TaxID=2917757 RepID=UPI001EF6A001|nr:methylamine utilization protein [Pseudoalteromonas sp. OOF1S-7]MCG7535709.1 methylamine utilization protein [Pseudoalteromonas sp. OOF1S-7]